MARETTNKRHDDAVTISDTNELRTFKVTYLVVLHALLIGLILWVVHIPAQLSDTQAQKIALGEALKRCTGSTVITPTACEGVSVQLTATRYWKSDGKVHNGFYFLASSKAGFRTIIALDQKGDLVVPTPDPLD